MKTAARLLLLALVLCCVSVYADVVVYTDSGTFSSDTASSDPTVFTPAFSAPNETWSFSFEAAINPAVTDFGMGGFSFVFSDFTYELNGSPVSITPSFIRFFSGTNGGGFEICFSGATPSTCTEGLGTYGPQMYEGNTDAPTLIGGSFPQDSFGVIVDSTLYSLPDTTLNASVVPEPSIVLPLPFGFLALAGRRLYRRS